MAEPLKNLYNEAFVNQYCGVLTDCGLKLRPSFKEVFYSKKWKDAELKGRMSILQNMTNTLLPVEWEQKYLKIREIIQTLQKIGIKNQNLEYIFLADIVSEGAKTSLVRALPEIEFTTQFVSFEFAGRELIRDNEREMMVQMLKWASHSDENIRRFASEGCRPRLPWGLHLKSFIECPDLIIPILEKLKDDKSIYVRKSVANNLNDISKSHPGLVLKICQSWYGQSKERNWIVKQALRTLLKSGNKEALSIIGLDNELQFELKSLKLDKELVRLNEDIKISCEIINKHDASAEFRLEYYIYFLKNNGTHTKKIFKITEKKLAKGEKIFISKNHFFKKMTTRQHYEGLHFASIVVNGNESIKNQFILKNQ